jgi:hypothetical protein
VAVKSTKIGDTPHVPPTRALFESIAARLDRVAPAIAARIRSEIAGYRVLPSDEHTADVDRQIRNVVNGLLTGSAPSSTAVEHARDIGRRRARDGIALPDVIEAYHIAYREVWAEILGDAQAHPPLFTALASEVSLLWLWFHRLSAVVAESHAAESQARHSSRLALERELLDQLTGRSPHNDAVATEFGYRPEGEFSVACVSGLGQRDDAKRITELLHGAGRPAVCIYDSGRGVVVTQQLAAQQICAAILAIRPTAKIGLGIPRTGLAGAAVSLLDAEQALGRATEACRIVDFERDWLLSSLNAVKPRFEKLLRQTQSVARKHPRLAETVRAYVECRYSVSACARRLHIHSNSARYRLDRWKTLTGHDVETFSGLTASIIALELDGEASQQHR